jgi:MFS family permease
MVTHLRDSITHLEEGEEMTSLASGPPAGQPARAVGRRSGNSNLALAVLALTGLMLILDITITNVALPTIQRALDARTQDLQWVVNAYALAGGGFLLLGGRLADRLGRRRVFLAGMTVFALGSLAGGLAPSVGWLIAARGLQGLGAAITGPAAFSIITATFAEGPERNRAVGVWSAVAAAGGALGMLAGGLLTEYASWRWVLFVNVPVAALVLAATPRLVPDLPGEPGARTDLAGAVTVTGGLLALVYGTTQVPTHGWTGAGSLGFFVLAALLLAPSWLSRPGTGRRWCPSGSSAVAA